MRADGWVVYVVSRVILYGLILLAGILCSIAFGTLIAMVVKGVTSI